MKTSWRYIAVILLVLGDCPHVFGAGFGLYEASSASYALGGAVLGKAVDASANFFNPATLTDLTNATVTVGVMTETPSSRIKGYGEKSGKFETANMCPGTYYLPHFQLAVPFGYDFAFGLGIMPEYGLGSKYSNSWTLRGNSQKTEVTSITVNPNLAYKISDKWSVGAGLRILYFDFEQESNPAYGPYRFNNRLKGDNGMKDVGWQIGTKYDVTENLSIGLTYKSPTIVHVDGKTEMDGVAAAGSGDAWTELTLPQSVTGGFNWDISDDWHLGGVLAWTEWSSIDTLQFHLPTQVKPIKLEWQDTWRMGLAPSWDFAEDWTAMCSYVYESDCSGAQDSTMLPPSQRHMVSFGVLWHISANFDFSLVYGVILMDEGESICTNNGERYHYHAERGISHAAGVTVTYRF